MWNVAAEFEEFGENDVENSEHHHWTEKRPKVAEDRALIAELEIGFSEFFQ